MVWFYHIEILLRQDSKFGLKIENCALKTSRKAGLYLYVVVIRAKFTFESVGKYAFVAKFFKFVMIFVKSEEAYQHDMLTSY